VTELESVIADLADMDEKSASRIGRALAGVKAYAESGGPADPAEPIESILQDLLTDVMHAFRFVGVDFDSSLGAAREQFVSERIAEPEKERNGEKCPCGKAHTRAEHGYAGE